MNAKKDGGITLTDDKTKLEKAEKKVEKARKKAIKSEAKDIKATAKVKTKRAEKVVNKD